MEISGKLTLLTLLSILAFISSSNGELYGKCYTPDSFKGDCVQLEFCPQLKDIHENQLQIFQKRLYLGLSNAACGQRDGTQLVCCRRHSIPESTPLPTATSSSVPLSPRNPLLPKPGRMLGDCGSDTMDKIYGGNRTKIDEFPWMALVGYSKPNKRGGFHCGGVLISDRYVLTASHCVNGKDLPVTWEVSVVRLGDWDITSEDDCEVFANERVCSEKPIDMPVETAIPHELYEPYSKNQHHDIALLRMQDRVRFSQFIKPICLPMEERLRNSDFVSQTMSAAGWGKTQSGDLSPFKLKVNVDGISNTNCSVVYNKEKEKRQIVDTQLCAGGEDGFDTCRGDSGGPLMRLDLPYWYLAGLVSFGPSPCGLEGWPGVYTRVGKYIPWIEDNVKP